MAVDLSGWAPVATLVAALIAVAGVIISTVIQRRTGRETSAAAKRSADAAQLSAASSAAQRHRTGLHIDITGTGVLRITNPRGFENQDDNTVTGMTDGAESFAPLPVPADYKTLERMIWTPACRTSPTRRPGQPFAIVAAQ